MVRVLESEGEVCVHLTDVTGIKGEDLFEMVRAHAEKKHGAEDAERIAEVLADCPFFCYTDVDSPSNFEDWMETEFEVQTLEEFMDSNVQWGHKQITE